LSDEGLLGFAVFERSDAEVRKLEGFESRVGFAN